MATLNGGFLMNRGFKLVVVFIALQLVSLGLAYNKKPAGTIALQSMNLYVDRVEVSNFHWLEYLWDIRRKFGKDSDEYYAVLPDMEVWRVSYPGLDLIDKMPARSNKKDMPIVGISHEQAVNYCKWRSGMIQKKYG